MNTTEIMDALGFCSCGMPADCLEYIMHGLELIGEEYDEKKRKELFKTNGAEYFFFYWLDSKGITEHGCGVPGWITADGYVLLEILHEWDNNGRPAKYDFTSEKITDYGKSES